MCAVWSRSLASLERKNFILDFKFIFLLPFLIWWSTWQMGPYNVWNWKTYYYCFLLLFKYSCLHFPPPLPSAPPIPTSHPSLPPTHILPPFALSICPLYRFLDDPCPIFPHYPFPTPLWLLSVCSLFQCLWLYFVCLFVLSNLESIRKKLFEKLYTVSVFKGGDWNLPLGQTVPLFLSAPWVGPCSYANERQGLSLLLGEDLNAIASNWDVRCTA